MTDNGMILGSTQNERILKAIYRRIDENSKADMATFNDAFSCIRNIGEEQGKINVALTGGLKSKIAHEVRRAKEQQNKAFLDNIFDLQRKVFCYESPVLFESYLLYTEINRPFAKQFYMPRRKQLKRIVDAMQEQADDKLDLLAVSMPPGTGKSTLALFYITWLAGRNPEKPILTGSHANSFLTGAYAECLRMMASDGDYLWNDCFPALKVISTNAQDKMIDIGKDKKDAKRFTSLEFSSIGAGNAGKVRAEQLLYCDDLVSSMEESLSAERMNKLWEQYTVDLRQRKIGNCKELHIATRWSVRDVIGRLEQMYGDSPRARFIVMSALNEKDESNFDYPIEAGFTTQFYHEQREIMDDASWKALYMNEPIEREGLLYNRDELRRYFELPDGEPDAVLAVCDTKDTGKDFCFMPVAYQYGSNFYVDAVVYSNAAPEIIDEQIAQVLTRRKVQMCQFESNAAGGRTADKVQQRIKELGGITKITKKYTTQNKETKIIVNSPFVKEHCLFKDDTVIKDDAAYRAALNALCSYTMRGKNATDDVPDGMAMLALFCQNLSAGKVEVIQRPW